MSSCHVCKVVALSGLEVLIFIILTIYLPFFQSNHPSTTSSNQIWTPDGNYV